MFAAAVQPPAADRGNNSPGSGSFLAPVRLPLSSLKPTADTPTTRRAWAVLGLDLLLGVGACSWSASRPAASGPAALRLRDAPPCRGAGPGCAAAAAGAAGEAGPGTARVPASCPAGPRAWDVPTALGGVSQPPSWSLPQQLSSCVRVECDKAPGTRYPELCEGRNVEQQQEHSTACTNSWAAWRRLWRRRQACWTRSAAVFPFEYSVHAGPVPHLLLVGRRLLGCPRLAAAPQHALKPICAQHSVRELVSAYGH